MYMKYIEIVSTGFLNEVILGGHVRRFWKWIMLMDIFCLVIDPIYQADWYTIEKVTNCWYEGSENVVKGWVLYGGYFVLYVMCSKVARDEGEGREEGGGVIGSKSLYIFFYWIHINLDEPMCRYMCVIFHVDYLPRFYILVWYIAKKSMYYNS